MWVTLSTFVPNKLFLQEISYRYVIQKESATEAYRILLTSIGLASSIKNGFINDDLDLHGTKLSGPPKKFEDEELPKLLNRNPCQMLEKIEKVSQVKNLKINDRFAQNIKNLM